VLDTGDADLVVARVTTQLHSTANHVSLHGWAGAGLIAPSVVRLHKLATLDKSLVRARLGRLGPEDARRTMTVLRRLYGR